MLTDAKKDTNSDIEVLDLAELISEFMISETVRQNKE
jgi:hypothetical protein